MTELLRSRRDLVLSVVLVAGAVILPLFFGKADPFIDDATTALAYVVMALGLNIVVGFAGLLDLGYVAFFAIGAYTMGWLGSAFADAANGGKGIPLGVSGPVSTITGIHVNFLLVLVA